MRTRAVLVMGVSGSGKTTVGQALAERLGWAFADADDYHPESNRQKMASGIPLSDADREPWLLSLRGLLEAHLAENRPLVLACSALRERYREILTQNLTGVQVVFLHGSRDLLAQRMQAREHFMPVSLLESQLQTLEPPAGAITVDIAESVEKIVEQVMGEMSSTESQESIANS